MYLIRVGKRRINLEYLIMDEENDGSDPSSEIPPGVIRVTMLRGKEFDLVGDEAENYRRLVKGALEPEPSPESILAAEAQSFDPRRGVSAPRVPGQGIESG